MHYFVIRIPVQLSYGSKGLANVSKNLLGGHDDLEDSGPIDWVTLTLFN